MGPGTGEATVSGPLAISIDVAARKIYWLNGGNDTLSWASLDGSGGADLNLGTAMIDLPGALAVYPAAGKVYWTNWGFIGDGWISYASLDGSGGATLPITVATLDLPYGIAIDSAAGRVYWDNDNVGIVSTPTSTAAAPRTSMIAASKSKAPTGWRWIPKRARPISPTAPANALAFVRTDGTGGATLPLSVEKTAA